MAVSKAQVIGILELINVNYPTNRYQMTDALIDTWHACLGHYDLEAITAAVYKTISKSKFPPQIADINAEMKGLLIMGLPSEGEAWELAKDAVDFCGLSRYENGERRLGDNPLVLKAVNQLGGLEAIDNAEKMDVVRGQFMRIYRDLKERTVENSLSSVQIRQAAQIMGQSAQASIEGEKAQDEGANEQALTLARKWRTKTNA